jgi:hypothetical protein
MSDLKTLGIGCVLLAMVLQAHGQRRKFTSQPDSIHKNALVVYLGGGGGYFASREGAPAYLHPVVQHINPVGTVRVMWHPRFLLRVGLETGLVNFYQYTLKDSVNNPGKIRLSAIPVLLEWSMAVTRHFNLFAGSGAYIMITNLDYQQNATAYKFNVGWMAAASYIVPLSASTGLGTEAKWLYAAGTSNGTFCLQLQFVWKFLK